MARGPTGSMMKLVDRKRFTDQESSRRLKEHDGQFVPDVRNDYALELTVGCTRRRADSHEDATAFEVLLDTGFTGRAVISRWHYEHYCDGPIPPEELPPATLSYFDGREAEDARLWQGHLWVFPEGVAPDIEEPVRVPRGRGIIIVPPNANDACVGMWALFSMGARVEIDYDEQVFSVLIPKDLVHSR